MKRMNLFYSLLLAGFLATGYACLNDVPVFADELAETATESDGSAEVTEEAAPAEAVSENASYESAAPVSEETDVPVSEDATTEDSAEESVAAEETEADIVKPEKSIMAADQDQAEVTGSNQDQAVETGAASVESVTETESTGSKLPNGVETSKADCVYVTITMDSEGKLYAKAINGNGAEIGTSTNPYTLVYDVPSTWTEDQQKAFTEILESYVEYAIDKDPENPDLLNYEFIKVKTDPNESGLPQFIDADKYANPYQKPTSNTLDTYHCWAAEASNILWNSGWAQQATDPLTGKKFASEDEVMTYISTCYTDQFYATLYAIWWFFDGTYNAMPGNSTPANRTEIYSQGNDIDGTQQTGLLTDYDFTKEVNGESIIKNGSLYTEEGMSLLEDVINDGFNKYAYGVDITYYRYDEKTDSWSSFFENGTAIGGHALTLTGLLYNENATTLSEKFLAIMVADSDNDNYTEGDYAIPDNAAVATSRKASRINSCNIYEIKSATQVLDGKLTTFWYMPTFGGDPNLLITLHVLNGLKICTDQTMADFARVVEPTPQQDSKTNESSDSSTESELTTVSTNESSVIDQLVKAARVEFQKDPELNKKSFILRGASVNNKKYQWGTTYQLGKNWKYAFVANRALKLIGQITLDGKVLDPSEYTIISYDDVCVILFSDDFMQNLSAGQHIFTFSCEGFDEPTQMTVMVTE